MLKFAHKSLVSKNFSVARQCAYYSQHGISVSVKTKRRERARELDFHFVKIKMYMFYDLQYMGHECNFMKLEKQFNGPTFTNL